MITREMHVEVQFSLLARARHDGRSRSAGLAPTRTPPLSAGAGWPPHLPDAEVVHELIDGARLLPWSAVPTRRMTRPSRRRSRPRTIGSRRWQRGSPTAPVAVTRFVLVSRPGAPAPPTGADKTSLVAFIHDNHPGALLELLEQFAARGVDLTRIESRPTGSALGKYCFSIDAEGHIGDARMGEALMGLRRTCADVRFLGSYPRADGAVTQVSDGTSDSDFADATAWLRRLRNP